jgi:hypothetical protein
MILSITEAVWVLSAEGFKIAQLPEDNTPISGEKRSKKG